MQPSLIDFAYCEEHDSGIIVFPAPVTFCPVARPTSCRETKLLKELGELFDRMKAGSTRDLQDRIKQVQSELLVDVSKEYRKLLAETN